MRVRPPHTILPREAADGVTLTEVSDTLTTGRFSPDGTRFALPGTVRGSLAHSTARAAFSGPVHYIGHDAYGRPTYTEKVAR